MATYVGKVGEYDSSKETFRSYCDRMDMFFEANDLVVLGGAANAVADAAVVRKKRAIFLTELGADSFTLVNDLLAPRSAKEVELTEIARVLKEHYNPAPLEIAESFHFSTRVRKEGESIADFIVALKKLSIHCNFGVYLNRALRDRFVCGLNYEKIQNRLLNTVEWEWNTERDRAFKATKEMLQAAPVLTHYDPSKPMVLSCDASPYGVGAVLSHISDSGQEMPVAFASRKLNTCERRYSQLDKEGLSVVFGVCKFHKYLEGRRFRIQTDHKPLLGLLGADRPIPVMSSPRVQRWAVTLAGYSYDLVYRRGVDHGNADCMSRLPAPGILEESPVPADVVLTLEQLDTTTITSTMVREWTRKDPVLAQVVRLLEEGWPDTVKSEELSPY